MLVLEGRKIEVKGSLPGYGERYEVRYEYCQHAIQWEINYYSPHTLGEVEEEGSGNGDRGEGYYDLIPRLSCYTNLYYNPYDLILQFKEHKRQKESDSAAVSSVPQILSFLIESLEKDQSSKLELLPKSHRSALPLLLLSSSHDDS